jgi:hypothetical protein
MDRPGQLETILLIDFAKERAFSVERVSAEADGLTSQRSARLFDMDR